MDWSKGRMKGKCPPTSLGNFDICLCCRSQVIFVKQWAEFVGDDFVYDFFPVLVLEAMKGICIG